MGNLIITLRRHERVSVGEAPECNLPEAELLRAMLMQAVYDLQGKGVRVQRSEERRRRRAKLKRRARRWFESRRTKAGSFLWIGELLDLDAQAVRAAIRFSHNAGHNLTREIAPRVQHLQNIAAGENALARARTGT